MVLNNCLLIGAYFLGSIPFGLLITRWVRGVDIREVGSGNIGASNVSRACGTHWGRVTLLLDASKGVVATATVAGFAGWAWAPWAAVCAVVGHCWPIWLGFRGGKGVATTAGGMLVISPTATGLAVASWLVTYLLSRKSSLGAIVGSVVLATAVVVIDVDLWAPVLMLVGMVLLRHRENMVRLLAGEERDASL